MIVPEAQSLLLNYEELITNEFGQEAAIGNGLFVPLQLSEMRSDGQITSLRELQSQIPIDIWEFLNRHREDVPVEVLKSHRYALSLFFMPISANRERAADAIVRFLRPDDLPPGVQESLQQISVIPKSRPVNVASHGLLRPKQVVAAVSARLPFRFTLDSHTRAWRHFKVRPPTRSDQPESTDTRYCVWDSLMGAHGYTNEWIEMLVSNLSTSTAYENIIGRTAQPI